MMRILWLLLGFLCVALGIIGAVLPVLPTTPFMLLAAFAFAKSSPRLHRWIVDHPTFGPPVRDWQAHGAISRRAKLMAPTAMAAVLLLSLVLGFKWQIIAIQAATLVAVSVFILSRPEPPSGV